MRCESKQGLAERAARARCRDYEAAQDVEQRRLARAVGPDEAAGSSRECDAQSVNGLDATEADAEIVDFDHGLARFGMARLMRACTAPLRRRRSRGSWSTMPAGWGGGRDKRPT